MPDSLGLQLRMTLSPIRRRLQACRYASMYLSNGSPIIKIFSRTPCELTIAVIDFVCAKHNLLGTS